MQQLPKRQLQEKMKMMEQQAKPLVNRVEASGLITLDLEKFGPVKEFVNFDLKDYLWQELVLREKEFRQAVKDYNWDEVKGKTILVFCSNDAIIPTWAFMLVTSHATEAGSEVFQGDKDQFLQMWFRERIAEINTDDYKGARIVVKGCSTNTVPQSAYLDLTAKLLPHVRSLMYGEPCSTVPVFKRKTQ